MHTIGANLVEDRLDGSLGNLRRDLDYLAALGLDAVELPVHGLDAIRYGSLDNKRTGLVNSLLRDYGFKYTVHAPDPLDLMDLEDSDMQEAVLAASAEFAATIGARVLVVHPGRFVHEDAFALRGFTPPSDGAKQKLLEHEAGAFRKIAGEYPDLAFCLENARPYLDYTPHSYAEVPGPLKEQVERIGLDNVRINLDFGHLYMASHHYGFDPVEAVRGLAPLVAHTHIHDNFGIMCYQHERRQTRLVPFGKGDSHMPVGWGEVPFGPIMSGFMAAYEGICMMELRGRYYDHLGESKSNLVSILDRCLINTLMEG